MDRDIVPQQPTGAMRSSIGWALLGLVIERPSYGYELLQRFKRTYGETLALSGASRIYEALESLRVHALIEELPEEPAPQPTRLPKPRYRATEAGMRGYQDWLLRQLEEARQRGRLFARQLAMLEPELALSVIDEYERECLLENEEPEEPETERQSVAARLAEQEESLEMQVRMSWIEFARSELKTLIAERAEEGDLP